MVWTIFNFIDSIDLFFLSLNIYSNIGKSVISNDKTKNQPDYETSNVSCSGLKGYFRLSHSLSLNQLLDF